MDGCRRWMREERYRCTTYARYLLQWKRPHLKAQGWRLEAGGCRKPFEDGIFERPTIHARGEGVVILICHDECFAFEYGRGACWTDSV